jgi:hypothetical protein
VEFDEDKFYIWEDAVYLGEPLMLFKAWSNQIIIIVRFHEL